MPDIGLERGTVRLEPHNPAWQQLFAFEAGQIQAVLDIPLELIQHVGSTAIPEIVAKPIIDIAVLVNDLNIVAQWAPQLEKIGYWYKGAEPEMPDRRFFAKGPENKRTVYLHLANADEFNRLVKFRNSLINNPDLAAEYSALKQDLATLHPYDRATYTSLKNDFIKHVLAN